MKIEEDSEFTARRTLAMSAVLAPSAKRCFRSARFEYRIEIDNRCAMFRIGDDRADEFEFLRVGRSCAQLYRAYQDLGKLRMCALDQNCEPFRVRAISQMAQEFTPAQIRRDRDENQQKHPPHSAWHVKRPIEEERQG